MNGLFEISQLSRGGSPRQTIAWSRLAAVVLFAVSVLLAGCHGDPNVRKQKYLESGKRYSAQGKYKEAAIQFANAVKIDKAYAEAHYELAKSYLHLDQAGAAYAELMRTVELQPANYSARVDLGQLLLAARKPDQAKVQADAILAAQPNNADAHALLAAAALQNDHRDDALAEIRRALELDPKRAIFHEQLALIESADASNASHVEAELKNAIALDPKSVNPRMMLASFYGDQNRWQDAEQASLDAITANPKSLAAREGLAQIYARQNDPQKAESVLRQAAIDLASDPQGMRMLADYYERSGQADKAKQEFQALASKHPDDLSLQEAYVRSLLQVKDLGTAQSVIGTLMKKHSKDPQVMALDGIVLLNAGKTDDAIAALQNAVKEYPKDEFIQFWLGKAALAKRDLNLAETSFRQAAELRRPGLEAERELALIASQKGDLGLLSDVAEKTIAVAPTFADAYLWRAAVEMSRNSEDKAEADLQTAQKLAPSSATPYLQLGILRFSQKRFPDAIKLLEEALEKDPDSALALRLLVSYDLLQQHPEAALSRLNQQIAKRPENASFYDILAQFQIHANQPDQALASAQKAFTLNSNDAEAVILIAQVQVRRGQTESAIAAWEQWQVAHPGNAGVPAILGTLEETRGNQAKAEEYYKKSLQMQPEQPIAANNLAYLMLTRGENVDVALTLAQTARRAMPNSPNAADTLAWAYYHKQTYSFARDLLEEAIKTDASNQTIQYHLGLVYRELNDKTNAQNHFNKAISLAPNSPTAQDARAALQGLS